MPRKAVPEPYEQIVENLTSGVIAVDADGVILVANPAACRHLPVPPAELAPGCRLDVRPGIEPLLEVLRELAGTGQPISRREIVVESPEGDPKIIGLTASPLRGANTYSGAIVLFTDLTDIRRLERAAALNRQLAEIGQLTAGVVHELRNPLSVISGMAELAARRLGESHAQIGNINKIMQEAGHLERVIRQFLSFARPFDLEQTRCTAAEIVERAVQLTSHAAEDRRIVVTADVVPDIPPLVADPHKLGQSLANIAANAVEILEPGGHVDIRAFVAKSELLFTVDDNGPGIHLRPGEDPLAPFVSRKPGGTGLGLAIVHRIVTAHHGEVRYRNREEGGAHFEIALPLDMCRA